MKILNQMVVGITKGKDYFGKPKGKWVDNIKVYLGKISCENPTNKVNFLDNC